MASEWEFIVHGDAEAAIVDILLNETPQLSVYNIDADKISTNLIGYEFGDRYIVVTQGGGSEFFPVIDKPRIDIEVFAERRSVAHDIAAVCLASIKYQMGRYRGNGLFLSAARIEQGLTQVPDKRQGFVRYVFAVRLTCRADPDSLPPFS